MKSQEQDSLDAEESPEKIVVNAIVNAFRTRVIAGAFFLLPIAITLWLLATLYKWIVGFLYALIQWGYNGPYTPTPIETVIAAGMTIVLVLGTLYLCGVLAQSRIRRIIDWLLMKLPIVTQIYRSVRGVTLALQQQTQGQHSFSRVVLVAFPHIQYRTPGFVTSSCIDKTTGKTILGVYVPTTPVPTSGFMLLVPEAEVTELDWSVDDTLQAVISGGLTLPSQIDYYKPKAKDEMKS